MPSPKQLRDTLEITSLRKSLIREAGRRDVETYRVSQLEVHSRFIDQLQSSQQKVQDEVHQLQRSLEDMQVQFEDEKRRNRRARWALRVTSAILGGALLLKHLMEIL